LLAQGLRLKGSYAWIRNSIKEQKSGVISSLAVYVIWVYKSTTYIKVVIARRNDGESHLLKTSHFLFFMELAVYYE